MTYLVIENTPGYLPEDDPADFEDYDSAVAFMRERVAEYIEDGWIADEGWASADNLSAVRLSDPRKSHDLGLVIEIVIAEEDD